MERVSGIEPLHKPWQGFKLPLHHTRIGGATQIRTGTSRICSPAHCRFAMAPYWLGIKDSNLGHPDSESGVLPTELIPIIL